MTLADAQIQDGANLLLTFRSVRNSPGEGNDIFDQALTLAGEMVAAHGKDMRTMSLRLGYALDRAETPEAQRLVLADHRNRMGGTP